MKKLILISLLFTSPIISQTNFSPINSMPGSFSRMGFGARGIGMGNAISAVSDGNLVSYYNPALSAFQENNLFHTSYSFLSLDRTLSFINYTRKFEFKRESYEKQKASIAGISTGLILAGVSNIDLRDNEGEIFDNISTMESQFFISLSNRFSEKFALGIAFKFYYYKLYKEITTTSLGIDIGVLYSFNKNFNLSFVIVDLNSAYKWDTGSIYGQNGNTTTNKFPLLKKIGLAYKLTNPNIITAIELESSNAKTNYLRSGIEYNIYQNLFIRCGLDRFNLSDTETPIRPSFGFSYFYKINSSKVGIDYAFVIEPYSINNQHIIGLNINF
ncbi:MAG: hypothetical protein N2249_08615 [Melioribacter sp.]|nr:hypothetical protein [Melioribacter sp.]